MNLAPSLTRLDMVGLCRLFCLAVGPFLLLDGLTGVLFAPTGFAVGDQLPREEWNFIFHFNSWHQLLHVLNGVVLTAGTIRRPWAPLAAFVFGLGYAVMAPLGFSDGDDVVNLFYSGTPENLVHTFFALSGVGLGVLGLLSARRAVVLEAELRTPVRHGA
jgi:hypothetical protein